jgi:sugar/nucleoside kinase (ribokinase family)
MSKFLVVGSVAFDTLGLPSGRYERVVGGSATYASLAGSLFVPVRLVAVVGRDFPQSTVKKLEDRRVDTSGLEVTDGKTFFWEGEYASDFTSRTTLVTELNVFAEFNPKVPDSFRNTPFVMLGNIHPSLQLNVLEQIKKPSLVIADTMNYWIESTPKELRELLRRIDVLVINEEEARQLSGLHNIVQVAKVIRAMGPKTVIIKRGEYGAMLVDDQGIFSLPAHPVEHVVDPTGAGDSFAGGFLGFVAYSGATDPDTLRKAVIYGSAAASFCVQHVGIDGLLNINEQELRDRAESFRVTGHSGL